MFASRHRGATSFRGRTLLTRSFRMRSALSAEKNMAVLDFLFSFLLSGVRFLSLLRSQPRRMGCTGCRRIPGGNDPRKRTIRKTSHQRPYRVPLTRGSWVPPANPAPPKDQLKKTPTKERWLSQSGDGAANWAFALPSKELGYALIPTAFRALARWWLGADVHNAPRPYPMDKCSQPLGRTRWQARPSLQKWLRSTFSAQRPGRPLLRRVYQGALRPTTRG